MYNLSTLQTITDVIQSADKLSVYLQSTLL